MTEQIQISAKNVGAIALPNFCPRCFWLKLKLKGFPFQIFPGIFSSIDSYSKKIIQSCFDKKELCPPWLSPLGPISGYINSPHYSKFFILDTKYDIKLTGSPDVVFTKPDKSFIIADYKTAKFTETQDELLPMYEVQLNAYALIGEQREIKPVSSLALIYTEPLTEDKDAEDSMNHREEGFALGFSAHIHTVVLNTKIIEPLLAKTREVYEMSSIPKGKEGCKDCKLIEALVKASS
jgi:hypothetical protein